MKGKRNTQMSTQFAEVRSVLSANLDLIWRFREEDEKKSQEEAKRVWVDFDESDSDDRDSETQGKGTRKPPLRKKNKGVTNAD